jgi:putative chitinase
MGASAPIFHQGKIMITIEQLRKLFTYTKQDVLSQYVDGINKTIDDFKINNPALFLAQIGVETGGFHEMEENLNYSSKGLMRVFPHYFRDRNPDDYAHQPEKIANLVYGNRMGNGDETSGDGYKFRGRGAIQLTGKNNYQAFANALSISIDEAVDYIATPEGAIMSAGWFWSVNKINDISDDPVHTSRRINGGDIGLQQRLALYEKAQEIIG